MVALNPYENLDSLYNQDTIRFYKTRMKLLTNTNKEMLQQKLRELEPHLFKVAQMSYDALFENYHQMKNIAK